MKEEIIHEENQIFENFFIYLALYAFLDLSKLLCQAICPYFTSHRQLFLYVSFPLLYVRIS